MRAIPTIIPIISAKTILNPAIIKVTRKPSNKNGSDSIARSKSYKYSHFISEKNQTYETPFLLFYTRKEHTRGL